jgi:hypothetical protein
MEMSRVESLVRAVKALDEDELSEFRAWFGEYEWSVWDHQLESDIRRGRLDDLADGALRDHGSGRTEPL